MGADIRQLENRLDRLTDRQQKLSAEIIPVMEKMRDAMKRAPGSTELSRLSEQVDHFAPQLKGVQDAISEINKRISDEKVDAAERAAGIKGRAVSYRHPAADKVREHEGLKHFLENMRERRRPSSGGSFNSGKVQVGNFARKGIDYKLGVHPTRHKTPDFTIDTATNAPIVTPQYFEEILLQPRKVTVLRSLIPSLTTENTNSVITYREVRKGQPATTLASAISGSDTDLTVTSTTGIGTTYPFNQLTVTDGTNTETVTATAVNSTTGVVTISGSFSNSYATADTTVRLLAVTQTGEGVLKPQFESDLESYTINIIKLASWIKITTEALGDITGIEDFINNVGSIFISEMEEWNMLYGPSASSAMAGLFSGNAETDIPELAAWSTFSTNTTIWDYLVEGFYDRADADVMANAALVSVDIHKQLSQLKGSDGHYVWTINQPDGMPRTAFIGEVFWSSFLQDADAMVGDFETACRIYDRSDASVSFGLDSDDFTKNKVTALFESRVGMGIRLPRYLVKLDADSAPT